MIDFFNVSSSCFIQIFFSFYHQTFLFFFIFGINWFLLSITAWLWLFFAFGKKNLYTHTV